MKITWKRSETITLNVFSNVRHEIKQFRLPNRLYQAKTIDLTLFWLIANESQSLVYALLPIAKSTKTDFSKKRWVTARDLIYSYSVMQKINSIRFSRWSSTWQGVSGFRGQNRRCWEIAVITWLQKDQNWFWGQTIFSGKRFGRVWFQNGSTTPQTVWARSSTWQGVSEFYSDAKLSKNDENSVSKIFDVKRFNILFPSFWIVQRYPSPCKHEYQCQPRFFLPLLILTLTLS